jgi:Class II histone deacetylase complex subunits 2 and 3.
MNLMDILSNEPPNSMYAESDLKIDSILEQNGESQNMYESSEFEPEQRIYYLPTILTRIQKELLEVMIQIFSTDLLNEIHSKNQRGSINSLLDNASSPILNSYDKLNLLFDQLMIIDKHPSLLVDHFIPKKLLLLETNEKLSTLSGKFLLFNKLVDTFIEEAKVPFHLLVVAPSIKELELIESLVIGKKMYYKNLSSNKLYDDNRDTPDFTSQQNNSSNVCLYLITSQQLYNNYLSSSDRDTKFNLIFSFDMKLDISSPSIEFLRSESKYTTVLIPIPIYSLEHIILQIPEPPKLFEHRNDVKNPLFKWKLQVLNTLIVNRFNIFEELTDFFIEHYGGKMSKVQNWLKDGRGQHFLNLMGKFDEKLVLNFSDDKVIKKIGSNYLSKEIIRGTIGNYDYKLYRATVAQYFNNRVIQLEEEIQKKYEDELPALRLKETERQSRFDTFNDQIGDNYRKLRRLNEDAGFAEKKLARADVDLIKKQQIRKELMDKLNLLKEKVADPEPKQDTNREDSIKDKLDEGLVKSLDENIIEDPKEVENDEEIIKRENHTKEGEEGLAISHKAIPQAEVAKSDNETPIAEETKSEPPESLPKIEATKKAEDVKTDDPVDIPDVKTVDPVDIPDSETKIDKKRNLKEALENQEQFLQDLNTELKVLSDEYEKINEENDSIRLKYQTSSTEAVQLSTQLAKLREQNLQIEQKLNGPGMRSLPLLIKKDFLASYGTELTKIKKSNAFLANFFKEKLDKITKERQVIIEATASGSSSRPSNRISRATTPL